MVLGLFLCPDGTLLALQIMVSIRNMIHVDIRPGMSKRHTSSSGQNVTKGTRLEPILKEHKECMSHWVIFLWCPIWLLAIPFQGTLTDASRVSFDSLRRKNPNLSYGWLAQLERRFRGLCPQFTCEKVQMRIRPMDRTSNCLPYIVRRGPKYRS